MIVMIAITQGIDGPKILKQAGITDVLQQLAINAGLSIWDLCCAVAGAVLSGRVGRRPMFLISYTGQLFTCAVSWTAGEQLRGVDF
jgi:hypothetical protein